MKVGIYSPYLDTAGGGEKYLLTIAECLSLDNQVDIFLDDNLLKFGDVRNINEKRHNLDLSKVNFIPAPLGKKSFLKKLSFLKKYDLIFYLTDGSIFYSSAKKNILHIQSPIINKSLSSPSNKVKLSSWSLIIYNSLFTQKNSIQYWKRPSKVIYPPVDVDKIKALKKEKIILNVGRFFGYLKPKKQEEMITVFKKIYSKKEAKGWSLYLAGGAGEGDQKYLEDLKKSAKGFPIKFFPNISHQDLIKLYGKSSIYWHAAGLNEEDPTKMEHFGITTVEAMAAGAVPIVINKGGQPEIVENDKSGFLWNDLVELENMTMNIIKNRKLRDEVGERAIDRSKSFSKEKFISEIRKISYD